MATIRLVPSTYSVSNTQYLSVTNESNMYNNTDNTTYATIYNSRTGTSSYYLYINGFNLDDVPSNAVVNSITIKIKGYQSGLSTSNSIYLVNNTTTLSYTASQLSTSASTITFSSVPTWTTIQGYGSNFGIRINCARSNRNTAGYAYIYGAEILVDYDLPTYTVTSTITGGTLTSSNPMTVDEGSDAIIVFAGNDGYDFTSMTVNGTSVTPTSGTSYSYTISNITADQVVIITFTQQQTEETDEDEDDFYIKINETWTAIKTCYQKIDGVWTVVTYAPEAGVKLIYKGHISSANGDDLTTIGTVSSSNVISITDTDLASGTYTLYYNDNAGKLAGYDAIGTVEV